MTDGSGEDQSKQPKPYGRQRFPREWKGLTLKQKKVLHALQRSMGIVQNACAMARVHRASYYRWMKCSSQFAECAEEIIWQACGRVEMKLMEKVLNGDTSAITFYLRGRDPERWGDRTTVNAVVMTTKTELESMTDEQLDRIWEFAKSQSGCDNRGDVDEEKGCGDSGLVGSDDLAAAPREEKRREAMSEEVAEMDEKKS